MNLLPIGKLPYAGRITAETSGRTMRVEITDADNVVHPSFGLDGSIGPYMEIDFVVSGQADMQVFRDAFAAKMQELQQAEAGGIQAFLMALIAQGVKFTV